MSNVFVFVVVKGEELWALHCGCSRTGRLPATFWEIIRLLSERFFKLHIPLIFPVLVTISSLSFQLHLLTLFRSALNFSILWVEIVYVLKIALGDIR